MSNEITTKITKLYWKGMNHKRCNIIKIRTAVKKTMSEAYIEDMKEELEEI